MDEHERPDRERGAQEDTKRGQREDDSKRADSQRDSEGAAGRDVPPPSRDRTSPWMGGG